MAGIWVNGIVAVRDKQPYIQLSNENGMVAQLSMAQARHVAMDILQMSARTEADAMIHDFFGRNQFPRGAGEELMMMFRDFRAKLDDEKVERSRENPDGDQKD